MKPLIPGLNPSDPNDFCLQDRFLWLGIQAIALRERDASVIDWDTLSHFLVEEAVKIQHELREIVSELCLMLIECKDDPNDDGLIKAVTECRDQLLTVLQDNPSLTTFPAAVLDEEYKNAHQEAQSRSGMPSNCPWSAEQVFDLAFFPGRD
jgi:hypothetical protein